MSKNEHLFVNFIRVFLVNGPTPTHITYQREELLSISRIVCIHSDKTKKIQRIPKAICVCTIWFKNVQNKWDPFRERESFFFSYVRCLFRYIWTIWINETNIATSNTRFVLAKKEKKVCMFYLFMHENHKEITWQTY